MKRRDWMLAGGVLILAAVLAGCFLLFREPAGRVVISAGGKTYAEYSLSEDREIEIGKTNILVIKDGTAKMLSADCPDQLCVRQTAISRSGETIICLPNEVVVTIEGGGDGNETDVIAG